MTTPNPANQSPSILDLAKEIIYGDREKTYGKPDINIKNIADHWTLYLRGKIKNDILQPLTTDDVCYMMVLLKVARLQNDPKHRDSMIDAAGYLALAERIQEYHRSDYSEIVKDYNKAEDLRAKIELAALHPSVLESSYKSQRSPNESVNIPINPTNCCTCSYCTNRTK